MFTSLQYVQRQLTKSKSQMSTFMYVSSKKNVRKKGSWDCLIHWKIRTNIYLLTLDTWFSVLVEMLKMSSFLFAQLFKSCSCSVQVVRFNFKTCFMEYPQNKKSMGLRPWLLDGQGISILTRKLTLKKIQVKRSGVACSSDLHENELLSGSNSI